MYHGVHVCTVNPLRIRSHDCALIFKCCLRVHVCRQFYIHCIYTSPHIILHITYIYVIITLLQHVLHKIATCSTMQYYVTEND